MDSNQCFLRFQNNVYAFLNWRLREKPFDVMVLHPLDTRQLVTYQKLLKQGRTDESIFNTFFPPVDKPKKRVLIDVDLLTKEQLVHLICTITRESLPSLSRMSTEDLKTLFSVLDR